MPGGGGRVCLQRPGPTLRLAPSPSSGIAEQSRDWGPWPCHSSGGSRTARRTMRCWTTMSTGAAFVIPLAFGQHVARAVLRDLIAPALTQSRLAACQALAMGGARMVGAVWSPTGETAD